MSSINITQLTVGSKSNGAEVLSLDSPEVSKALSAACQGEAKVRHLWLKAANTVHQAGVTYMMLTKEGLHQPTWDKLQRIVINSQSANEIVLFNSKTIELNSTQRAERDNVEDHVRLCMRRIGEHLKRLEHIAKNGLSTANSMGEGMAKKCQEMIDSIRKAKEGKLDFNAPEAIRILQSAKAEFMKARPTL